MTPWGHVARIDLVITATPHQTGLIIWSLDCYKTPTVDFANAGQDRIKFPATVALPLPTAHITAGCIVVADAQLYHGGSATIALHEAA